MKAFIFPDLSVEGQSHWSLSLRQTSYGPAQLALLVWLARLQDLAVSERTASQAAALASTGAHSNGAPFTGPQSSLASSSGAQSNGVRSSGTESYEAHSTSSSGEDNAPAGSGSAAPNNGVVGGADTSVSGGAIPELDRSSAAVPFLVKVVLASNEECFPWQGDTLEAMREQLLALKLPHHKELDKTPSWACVWAKMEQWLKGRGSAGLLCVHDETYV